MLFLEVGVELSLDFFAPQVSWIVSCCDIMYFLNMKSIGCF